MIEEPVQFGESGRLFGILTLPEEGAHDARALPTFIFLTSGLLHRVGPRRLYVRLARELAQLGFSSLRVDMAGRGDSLSYPGLTNYQSAAEDYAQMVHFLESRLGSSRYIVGGLCSAADDAVALAPTDARIVGMLLLDPVCERDRGFALRKAVKKLTNPNRYSLWLKRRIRGAPRKKRQQVDLLSLRHYPSPQVMRSAFDAIRERDGRVISVFTHYARSYLNQSGQMGRVLGVDGYRRFCTELYWPGAEHSFPLEFNRARLIEEVKAWASGFKHS